MPVGKIPKMRIDTNKVLELRAASGSVNLDQFANQLGLTKPTIREFLNKEVASQRIIVALCLLATKVYKRTITPSYFAKNDK